jgi:hypothetical protein
VASGLVVSSINRMLTRLHRDILSSLAAGCNHELWDEHQAPKPDAYQQDTTQYTPQAAVGLANILLQPAQSTCDILPNAVSIDEILNGSTSDSMFTSYPPAAWETQPSVLQPNQGAPVFESDFSFLGSSMPSSWSGGFSGSG